jgi:hypothetical protein
MLAGNIKSQEYLAKIIRRKWYGDKTVGIFNFNTAVSQGNVL